MSRETIRGCLFKRSRTLPGGGKAAYWIGKVPGSDGRPTTKSFGRVDAIGKREARRMFADWVAGMTRGEIARDTPDRMTLTQFEALYLERRAQGETGRGFRKGSPRLDPATLDQHKVTLRYMRAHFGDGCAVAGISADGAERFLDALAGGKLASASKVKRSAGSTSNMRKHVRIAKGIFSWALHQRIVTGNSFDDFDGRQGESATPYIDVATVEQVMQHAPSARWRALFALCRYAGLRVGEALHLPWTGEANDLEGAKHAIGVDWDKRRIHLVAEKTGRYCIVPMVPRLCEVLREAAAESGEHVCGFGRDSVHHTAKRCVSKAGLPAWRKLFQALRKSAEDDWKASGVAEATYAAWMGHSPNVSRKHYVSPTEAEFEQVTRLRLVG